MNRLSPLIVAFILGCGRPAVPTSAATPAQRSFRISNTDYPFLLRTALTGRVDVFSDSVVIVAHADTIVDHSLQADAKAERPQVRAALASGDRNARWRLDYESAWQPIDVIQQVAVTDSARFVIAGVRPRDLANRWLVFELSSVMTDQRSHQRVRASNFLHTAADIFHP